MIVGLKLKEGMKEVGLKVCISCRKGKKISLHSNNIHLKMLIEFYFVDKGHIDQLSVILRVVDSYMAEDII